MRPTHGLCDTFAEEGQACSGYEALRRENERLRKTMSNVRALLYDYVGAEQATPCQCNVCVAIADLDAALAQEKP